MTAEVYIPKMSDHMETGRIMRWLVNEGETVTGGRCCSKSRRTKRWARWNPRPTACCKGCACLTAVRPWLASPSLSSPGRCNPPSHLIFATSIHKSAINNPKSSLPPPSPGAWPKTWGSTCAWYRAPVRNGRVREGDVRALPRRSGDRRLEMRFR